MKRIFKKIKKVFSLEFYEDILVKIFRFFMHRNPLFIYFWLKYYLLDGAFRKDKENRRLFYGKYQSFNQRHPYISASTSFVLILVFVFSSVWWLVLRSPEPAAAWWDDTWGYRKEIPISYSGSENLTEYQVLVDDLDTATLISEGKMQDDCDDIRFTDLNGNLLKYSIVGNTCNTLTTKIWVKTNRIPASDISIYMYYGNSGASFYQNERETFGYSEEKTVGYVLNDGASAFDLISLENDNSITHNGITLNLNKGQSSAITASAISPVSAKKLFNMSTEEYDTIVPVSWASTEFVYRNRSSAHATYFYLMSPWGTATVQVFINGAQCGTDRTVTDSGLKITDCGGSAYDVFRITSDIPIIANKSITSSDAYPLYPATTGALYGWDSSGDNLGAGPNGSNYQWIDSGMTAGSSGSVGANSGNYIGAGGGSYYSGDTVKVQSTDYPIGVSSQADGDGSDATTYLPNKEFGTITGSPYATDFVSILSDQAVTCSTYKSDGTIIDTQQLSSANSEVYELDGTSFGIGNSDTYIDQAWYVECDKPAMFISQYVDDEQNMWSYPMMRQFTYPTPAVGSLGSEEKSKGPVGYWSFDEGYGTTAQDGSQNDNDGTITGASWQTEDQCVAGKCLAFDDTNNNVVNINSESFSDSEAWSFSHWVNWKGQDDDYVFYAGSGGGTENFLLRYSNNNRFAFRSSSTGYASFANNSSDNIVNKWTFLSWVANGSGDISLYVNGNLLDTLSGVGTAIDFNYLGRGYSERNYASYPDNTYFLKGYLDEPKIYNYARTEDEIKQDYNAGLAGMGTSKGVGAALGSESPAWMSDGLVGYWKMDESSYDSENNQILDASGNQNHAEAVNLSLVNDRFGRGNSAIKLETNQENLLMNYMIWEDGQTGRVGDFGYYSTGNSRVFGEDPWGRDVVVWQSGESGDETYPAQGGIYHDSMSIDNSKLYRMSWWEKRVTNAEATYGRYYAGLNGYGSTNGVINLSAGTYNTNPYFWNTDHSSLTEGEWFLVVGHVFPYDHTGTTRHSDSGRYTVGGFLGNTSVDYKWAPETTTARSRTLAIYRGTDENMVHHTVYPRMDVVDGTEPSIQDLLDGHDKYGDNIEIEITQNKESYAFWYDHNSDGSWEHVVNSSGNYYVNGEPGTPTKDPIYISGDDVYVGREDMETYLDGTISDLRIYNRTLSPEEVKGLYEYAPGPVLHLKMDEKSGTTAYDTSGNENHGDLINEPTWTEGKYGGGLEFDGSDDYVATDSIEFNKSFSVGAWINSEQPSSAHSVFGAHKNMSTRNSVVARIYNDGQIRFGFWGDDLNTSAGDISFNQWQYLNIIYDYEQDKSKVYVNGKLVGESSSGPLEAESPSISIGSWTSTSEFFDGIIDDVKIYNYAIDQKQIVEDMNAGHPVGGSPVGSQVSYWKFDEGYDTTTYDHVGDNDGTINGASWTNDGKFGKALSFGGGVESGDYVTLGSSHQIDLTSATISFWAKRNVLATTQDTTNANGALRIFEGGAYYKFIDQLVNDQYFQFNAERDVNSEYWASFISSVEADTEWHHFIITADDNVFKLYIDGEYQGTDDDSSASNTSNTCTITNIGKGFGAGSSAYGSFYDGYIDEVKFYDYPLSENEIKKDYNQGKSLVMGSSGETSSGLTGQAAEYCVPGDTSTCNPPVAEWKFDDKSGTTVYDTSGNGNHGTMTNMEDADWQTSDQCKKGRCMNFNESDEKIALNSPFGKSGYTTVSLWYKRSENHSSGSWRTLVGHTSNIHHLIIHSTSRNLGIWDGGWKDFGYNPPDDGKWHHYEVIYNSGTSATLYVDGVYKNEISTVLNLETYPISTIGNWGGGTYWSGFIDNIKIYDYARTPAQIAWDHNRGKPIAHWKMDEGEGMTVHDESGNGNHGTMQNMSSDDWVDGKNNGGLDFDGSDDYVDLGNYNTNEAVSFWFKTDSSAEQVLLGGFFANYDHGAVTLRNNELHISRSNGAKTIRNDLNDGEWHHVVISHEANFSIYIDGKKEETCSFNECSVSSRTSASKVIGAREYSLEKSLFFNGQIDDVQIYNYALTPLQIKEIYNGGAVNYR